MTNRKLPSGGISPISAFSALAVVGLSFSLAVLPAAAQTDSAFPSPDYAPPPAAPTPAVWTPPSNLPPSGVGEAPGGYAAPPPAPTASAVSPAAPPLPAAAEDMITEVRIVGNKSLPAEEITKHLRTRAGRPFNRETIEEDAHRLHQTGKFLDVRTFFQRVPGGRVVIFEVLERPILTDVKFVGNEQIGKKKLAKETGLKPGDPLDNFAVEEARRKLETFYKTKGFDKARVTLIEGDKPTDRRAVFLINEGVKLKVQMVTFIGNTIASDERLQTQIKTKNPILFLFKGELDRKELEEDVQRLTAYYRGLGFFRARIGYELNNFNLSEHYDYRLLLSRVGRELNQLDRSHWIVVTFVIDEGPRFKIRNISIEGNTKYSSEELLSEMKLHGGEYFNRAAMLADRNLLEEKYGGIGYVFCDVKAEPRLLEEPGALDLKYKIKEHERYRVGKIDVLIKGEYPHTKITTVLNRLSLRPGDIVDIREIRASERRLRYSQLFENNPAQGEPPKIAFTRPLDEEENEEESNVARNPRPRSRVRMQSPDAPSSPAPRGATAGLPGRVGSMNPQTPHAAPRDRTLDLTLSGTAANPQNWDRLPVEPYASLLPAMGAAADPQNGQRLMEKADAVLRLTAKIAPGATAGLSSSVGNSRGQTAYAPPQTTAPTSYTSYSPAEAERVVRSQYTPSSGPVFPRLRSRLAGLNGQNPSPSPDPPSVSLGTPSTTTLSSANGYPAPGAYANANGNGGTIVQPVSSPVSPPGSSPPGYGSPSNGQPTYPATGAASSMPPVTSAYSPPSSPPPAPGAAQPASAPLASAQSDWGPPVVAQPMPPSGNAPAPENFYTNATPVSGTIGPFDPTAPYFGGPPDPDPLRDLQLHIQATEAQTGRFMVGVGVNSEAGLFGSIIIDEQNFDLTRFPRSLDDLRTFTAFRGAGQRLRIEAVPGTQFQRYVVSFEEPYLLDTAVSTGVSGYYYNRAYPEWFEERIGGRVALGYQFTPDLTGTLAYRGARVNITDIANAAVPELAAVKKANALHGFQAQLAYDTRDNPFLATEGGLIQGSFEEVIGSWQYPRAELELSRHFKLHERPDGSGRHVLTLSGHAAYTGPGTPIYDRYYAGGIYTLRGFQFREASPVSAVDRNVYLGGDFMLLASLQYMFPITADDMLRAVIFCDSGTVEPSINDWTDRYRVAPGFGLRITVPAMGSAPIALDFAFPVAKNPTDRTEVFSFFIGIGR